MIAWDFDNAKDELKAVKWHATQAKKKLTALLFINLLVHFFSAVAEKTGGPFNGALSKA